MRSADVTQTAAADAAAPRHDAAALTGFARDLFAAAGLEADKAAAVARFLVEADLMGHTTHGLALATWYLTSIAQGGMTRTGAPEVLSDRPAAVAWSGRRLPGAWLTASAVDLACARAAELGSCTVAVGDAHHIGCLAAYLPLATDRGYMISITSSSPSGAMVAPFGGTRGIYSPDPVAYGIPTPDDPILIDISASITTYNMSLRLIREGRQFDHDWLLDAEGTPSGDPRVLEAGGTILPAGGVDHGQKGYGMALFAEAVTQGLSGHGRADAPKGTVSAFTVQVWDPAAFGGSANFLRQTGWLAEACRTNPPRPGVSAVRLPGQAGLARRRTALASGVTLHPGILDGLAAAAAPFGLRLPDPL